MSETVLYEVRDGVAVLTFNRPESLNAMNPEMLDWMPEVTRRAADDPDVRCVVVTGAGRAFSAGGDMKGRGQARPDESPAADLVSNGGRLRRQEEMSRLLFEMAKPTIAAVNGPAFGAGFSVALAADFRVVSDQARFGTAFARVGFSGDFGGTWMLQRMVGIARAKELYMLGTTLDARQAEAMGLATKVVPHEALMDEAMAMAGQLAEGPTGAFGRMKDNFSYGSANAYGDLLTREAENMSASGKTAEHLEAVRAFLEKREPKFR